MNWLEDTIKRVRDHDASRPRSLQVAVGWSEVGGCRAQLGYRLDGAWPSDETDTWAAQRGTALHAYLQDILAAPGVRMEVDTSYRGIPGHADIVDATSCTDIKTSKLANSKLWADDHSLLFEKRVQVHGYGAGLIDAGELPQDATMRLLVVPADGTFADWWTYEEPFDRSLADHGADRLQEVRDRMAAGEHLPKDKPYAYCREWCEFFSAVPHRRRPGRGRADHRPGVRRCCRRLWRGCGEGHGARQGEGTARGTDPGTARHGWRVADLPRQAGRAEDGPGRGGDPRRLLERGFEPPMTTKPGNAPRLNVTRIRRKADK